MAWPLTNALTPDNPWPGLASFSEKDCNYFFGRDDEIRSLYRVVQRATLSVLFGRSGLGKTSLLNAGLFPLLRHDNKLPVYVRLDHSENAPPPDIQVLAALCKACQLAQVQAESAAPGESLWSYFQRRDVEFWSEQNRPVLPVIVLDQFEEIFTARHNSEASHTMTTQFLRALGDLIENRPPEAVRQLLEANPGAANRFEFKRSRIKVVISFREDFLAELEALKQHLPSIMYNRFRLIAMDGHQAYQVVAGAGHRLVDDDIARRIVQLAWKNEPDPPAETGEFGKMEIDPALLSVICTELNRKRRENVPQLPGFTRDLLQDADREILLGFYARSMTGCSGKLRAFIEDELVTERGFRDSFDYEDAISRPGVTRDDLEMLVERRLLRIDERRGMRRLELAHDVLTSVVRKSRDERRAREAIQQAQRKRRVFALKAAGMSVAVALLGASGVLIMRHDADRRHRDQHDALMAAADKMEKIRYDTALLLHLEAHLAMPSANEGISLSRRFQRHPHLTSYLRGHRAPVFAVAASDDGKLLASSGYDQTVMLWDVETHAPLGSVIPARTELHGIAFRPNTHQLAIANGELRTVTLWDADSRQVLRELHGSEGEVISVAFSPDGTLLAAGGFDKTVLLWKVDQDTPPVRLRGHADTVSGLAFSPDCCAQCKTEPPRAR